MGFTEIDVVGRATHRYCMLTHGQQNWGMWQSVGTWYRYQAYIPTGIPGTYGIGSGMYRYLFVVRQLSYRFRDFPDDHVDHSIPERLV
jgi:hypothetical protein